MPSKPALSTTLALIVAAILFMQNLDSAIIATSLPQMAGSFGVHPVQLSIGITAYILAAAAFTPLSGWLADRLGGRAVLAGAVVVFTVASAGCAVAGGLLSFVLARVVQGMAAALMGPVGQALVLRNSAKEKLIGAIGLMVWPALLAPVLGPVLGGFITTYGDWRWNFLLNLPLGAIGLALVLRFVPHQVAAVPPPLDRAGFVLSAAALVCLMEGFDLLTTRFGRPLTPSVLLVAGMALGVLAVRHLRHHPTPLLNLAPLQVHSFSVAAATSGAVFRALFSATPFLLALLFQLGFGLNAAQAGLFVLAYFAGNILMKIICTPILRRFGFRNVLLVSGALSALTIGAFGWLRPGQPALAIDALLLAAGAARSMHLTSLTTIAFADVQADHKTSASTLLSMLMQASMAVGIAVPALMLSTVAHIEGGGVGLATFHPVFAVLGLVALLTTLHYGRLGADAGAAVTGR